ncbi:hypothetical protein ACHAWO_011947 [Cyclotella atomus]|uniref:Uncharacterized protein n=1 Tax=Cyclotella atomus TaxID=382360 RepID=A0ABD3PB53_9STRA
MNLKDVKKKDKFLQELHRIYEHQNIKMRVEELAEALKARGPTPALIQIYQTLDDDITRAMRAAAKRSGRKDFGYQRSDVLIMAGRRTIASCVRNKTGYSDKALRLAELLEFDLPAFDSLTYQKIRKMVTEAIHAKREIQRMAAEHRALWLERLAQEAATMKPGSEWEKILKQMITASRQKATNKRLNSIFRPEWTILRYQMKHGSCPAMARNCMNSTTASLWRINRLMNEFSNLLVLPPDSIVVNVTVEEDAIYVEQPPEHDPPKPTWRSIDDPEEMQEWLRRRNKRHLNQMYAEERPPTRVEFNKILAEHGTSEVAIGILEGTLDPSTFGLDENAAPR